MEKLNENQRLCYAVTLWGAFIYFTAMIWLHTVSTQRLHCKSIPQLFWMIIFIPRWAVSLLVGMVAFRMTPPPGHRALNGDENGVNHILWPSHSQELNPAGDFGMITNTNWGRRLFITPVQLQRHVESISRSSETPLVPEHFTFMLFGLVCQ